MSAEFPYRTRRTVKPNEMNSARGVPHELLVEILEDANWAPTHGLTQPWRFHVFTQAARESAAVKLEQLCDVLTPAAERREDKRAKLRANLLAAPVAIAVAAKIEPGGKISELDEISATACAVQNLMLSAHQRGLATFWSSAPVVCSSAFAEWLGMDSTHRGMGIVYLGYAAPGVNPRSTRAPLGGRVTFHSAEE